jgi:hypothetical protein
LYTFPKKFILEHPEHVPPEPIGLPNKHQHTEPSNAAVIAGCDSKSK